MNFLEHGKPIFAPKLEKMASVSAAIALWNHAIATVTMPHLIKDEILEWIDVLPVPKLLSKPIKRHFYVLRKNVLCWISYVTRQVFIWKAEGSRIYQLVNYIIWHSNGTINSAETARNLLKSDELTIIQKFRLACTYCLREEIEKIWSMVGYEDNYDLVSIFRFFDYPLVYYWRYYFADDLDSIRTPENVSIDEFMIKRRYVNNWPAIEYFFDRLDAEKQVTLTIWSIDERKSSVQKFLLVKLNESQRSRVIIDRFTLIMDNYTSTRNIDDDELAISTWHDARDLITEKQFLELFYLLLEERVQDFILTEIWNTARDDFKRHILNHGDDDFIKRILEWCVNRPKQSCTFLSAVLTDHVSADVRREITKKAFFSEWCVEFIDYDAVEVLDQLINSCFPTAEESTKFKLTLTKTSYFGKHCDWLLKLHKIRALANLLNVVFPKTDPSSVQLLRKLLKKHSRNLDQRCLTYYSTGNLKGLIDLLAPLASSYPEIISDYKSKLLVSRAGFKACVKLFSSANDVLVEVIADGIPANQAAEFKKRIIFSYEGIDKLQNMLIKGYSIKAKTLACLFLESDSDKKILRTLLIDRLKEGKRDVPAKTRKRFLEFLL
ncbi:uncharacterized protein LOC135844971 [Planococcus citri]|uniref:uncharacterized protein LOC135844971 n=1 Tax=Planococcus citri TaxID=170843 RepID=UPI0031FA408C